MGKLSRCRITCALLAFFAAMTIVARAQSFSTLYAFGENDGSTPFSPVAQGIDGRLYGTTTQGGDSGCFPDEGGCGTLFGISLKGKLTMLYALQSGQGATPDAGLLLSDDGLFYGTTVSGTIFTITRSGMFTAMGLFCTGYPNCPNGWGPNGLIQASDGNFYGTTYEGGTGLEGGSCTTAPSGCGTVFRLTPDGSVTTLYSFCSQLYCADGANPLGALVEGTDGNFYGVTTLGGENCFPYGCGTVFKISRNGSLVTMHSFSGNDGSSPTAGLTWGQDGTLYGTTTYGGNLNCTFGCGTVFKVTPKGAFATLYAFCQKSPCTDGAEPDDSASAGLTLATDGEFYGVTQYEGANSYGTIFKITSAGRLTTLHSFAGPDGSSPMAAPIQGTNGVFYGTTANGGNSLPPCEGRCGTIYSLDVGLRPFVTFVQPFGKVGQTGGILGQGFTGTTEVSFNGVPTNSTVRADTFLTATVPPGATTGYVTVTTPTGVLTSNMPFHVIP